MTVHRPAKAQSCAARPSGVITLLVAVALVVLASLASFYSTRSVWMVQLGVNNQGHAAQARLAAQAALAWAQSQWLARGPSFADEMASNAPCPVGVVGLQWQCTQMAVPEHPLLPRTQLSVVFVRDLVTSPHVVHVFASAKNEDQHSQAGVRESVFVPALAPAPGNAPTAALVLNGCVSEASPGSVRVCPLSRSGPACSGSASAAAVQTFFATDTNRNGSISTAEKNACLALSAAGLPGGGSKIAPTAAMPRSPCLRAAWRSVLGDISQAQLQSWSNAQERQGLHALSDPPRTIYWVDSPADWGLSVGTPDYPALLAFSAKACAQRCPRIAAHVHVVGTVALDAGCDDEKMRGWQSGWIEGQLVVEAGLPEWRSGTVWARANGRDGYILNWPDAIDTTRVQRVNGSWSTYTP